MSLLPLGKTWILRLIPAGIFLWILLPSPWKQIAATLIFLLVLILAVFFRDPHRPLPEEESLIWAPADGRVLSLEDSASGARTLRIFLSLLDVHIQRAPVSGKISSTRSHPGGYVLAMRPGARANFRNLIEIEPRNKKDFPILVEQIAGFLARRIACWVSPEQRVQAGEKIGMIYFGSQVALSLPRDVEILVQPGERVTGGITPVARWK